MTRSTGKFPAATVFAVFHLAPLQQQCGSSFPSSSVCFARYIHLLLPNWDEALAAAVFWCGAFSSYNSAKGQDGVLQGGHRGPALVREQRVAAHPPIGAHHQVPVSPPRTTTTTTTT
eukprot:CAMPEP_0113935768 /NCGR_PEP_ID=MMETSP1339-20121228/2853_1 /TAXON_ID=94617 /ORGANISM="Fibrocapsa japonica" /LENGTH=116 /DNA_ID=CAMNT_0000938027 /DNA_START=183 /DNA_END=530 /DNA_ORIENTATION=+ /assembly_acc=CAM_ASM_000762